MDNVQSPKIQIERIYTKELTCKVPQAPNFFLRPDFKENWQPTFSIEMHVKHQPLQDSQHEVTIQVIVSAKTKDNITALVIDLQQAGIFKLTGFTSDELPSTLSSGCVSFLYPYVCRAISDASVQAGFPPILLSPLNMEVKARENGNLPIKSEIEKAQQNASISQH